MTWTSQPQLLPHPLMICMISNLSLFQQSILNTNYYKWKYQSICCYSDSFLLFFDFFFELPSTIPSDFSLFLFTFGVSHDSTLLDPDWADKADTIIATLSLISSGNWASDSSILVMNFLIDFRACFSDTWAEDCTVNRGVISIQDDISDLQQYDQS